MNDTRYHEIAATVFNRPWAIQAQALYDIAAWLNGRFDLLPAHYHDAQVQAAARRRPKQIDGAVTVMPLFGVLDHRPSPMLDFFGGTSTERFGKAFDRVASDESVGAIVLDIDSPGGMVYGLEELSDRIFNVRNGKRPIIAVANDLMASAAYFVGTAADEVVVTPGGQVGSVGTLGIHSDLSKAFEAAGIDNTIIFAGENKTEGNPLEPLTDEARTELQREVDEYYGQFVAAVARNRGLPKKTVLSDFGQGRVFQGADAKRRGMADRVATLDEVLAGLGVTPQPAEPVNAMRPHPSIDLRQRRARLTRARNLVDCNRTIE